MKRNEKKMKFVTDGYSKKEKARVSIKTFGLSGEEVEILHSALVRISRIRKHRKKRRLHYKLVEMTHETHTTYQKNCSRIILEKIL